MRAVRKWLAFGLGVVVVAMIAGSYFLKPPPPPPLERPLDLEVSLFRLEGRGTIGLSGLARHQTGMFLSVPERRSLFVPFSVSTSSGANAAMPLEILDVPRGMDLEGLALLDNTRFALATEHHVPRDDNWILLGEITGNKGRITSTISVSYDLWKLEAEPNRGLEGLCFVNGPDRLIVAVETVIEEDGRRFAPIATVILSDRSVVPSRVELTTAIGKISALECRVIGDRVEVTAIERHYEVSRLIRFQLGDEKARPLIDLAAVSGTDPVPNFEGLAFSADDTVVLIADNSPGFAPNPFVLLLRSKVLAPD